MSRTSRSSARPARPRATDHRHETQQLRALAHPLRLRLLEMFARGRCTTMQVAAAMNEPPTRLYHHVNALERAGLLRLKETRQKRGTTEKYYEAVHPRISESDPAALRGKRGEVIRGLAMEVIEESRRELLTALANIARTKSSDGAAAKIDPPLALRMLFHVSPKERAIVQRRLVSALQQTARDFQGRRSADSRRWALTVTMAPTLAAASAGTPTARRARRTSTARTSKRD